MPWRSLAARVQAKALEVGAQFRGQGTMACDGLHPSFGRIFFRSSISAGLLVNACPGILDLTHTGDRIELDAVTGRIMNLMSGKTLDGDRLPDFLREMIEMGGEIPYIKAQLKAAAA